MHTKALARLPNAYAPFSNFHVASCIFTKNQNYSTGVNVENSSYGLSVCAESAAISNMICQGDSLIESILVISDGDVLSVPCGACRQKIYEFSTADTIIYVGNKLTIFKSFTIKDLLPEPFKLFNKSGS